MRISLDKAPDLGTLNGNGIGETIQAQFSRRVVCLFISLLFIDYKLN